MFKKAAVGIAILVVFLGFLLASGRYASGTDAMVIDIEGDEYLVTDIKTYGNISGVWLEEPQCSFDEIYYSFKIGPKIVQKRIPLSDIKEISFEHDNSEHLVHMQVIKRDGDVIKVDYGLHKVTEGIKDSKIRHYETTEDKTSPDLIGNVKVKGKQLFWQGFVGKEVIPGGKGDFFIHSSIVKKIIFGTN